MAISKRVHGWLDALARGDGDARRKAADGILSLGEDYFVGEKLPEAERQVLLTGMRAAMDAEADEVVKSACLAVIAQFPLRGEEALAIVERGLRDRSDRVAAGALFSCSRLGHETKPLAELILDQANRPDRGVRRSLAWAMRKVGVNSARAVDVLLPMTRDRDRTTAHWAIEALRVSTPGVRSDVLKHVTKLLKHREGEIRGVAIRCVARLPGDLAKAIRRLEKIAKADPLESLRYDAAMAIVDIGPPARRAFPVAATVLSRNEGGAFTAVYLERIVGMS